LNLLDRYIFKSVLLTCAGAVALFAFVLTFGNVVRDLLGLMLSGQLELAVCVELVLDTLVAVTIYALPMGVLTGVLLTLGRLSADSEITAMRASGLSLFRIARPVFILAALGAAAALYVNFESMPASKYKYEQRLAAAVRANPLSFIAPKTFIRDFRGRVVYIGDRQGTVMHDIWVWELDDDGRAVRIVHAQSGRLDFDDAANEFVVVLNNAQWEERNVKNPEDFSEPSRMLAFASSQPERLPLDGIFGRSGVRQKLQWMTYAELRAEQDRLAAQAVPAGEERNHERDRMKVALTIQDKFNLSLAVLSFGLMGVPLGIKVSRRETSANLGVAILLALGYYFLTTTVGWLDRHPEYRPDLLLWAPNAIMLGLGAWLFRRIDRK
jgi:lipopolysaccharide export system permease protein